MLDLIEQQAKTKRGGNVTNVFLSEAQSARDFASGKPGTGRRVVLARFSRGHSLSSQLPCRQRAFAAAERFPLAVEAALDQLRKQPGAYRSLTYSVNGLYLACAV